MSRSRRFAGKNVVVFKVKAFAFGSAALGLGGRALRAFHELHRPDLFAPLLTLYVKLSLLTGGLGNSKGAVLGAVLGGVLSGVRRASSCR